MRSIVGYSPTFGEVGNSGKSISSILRSPGPMRPKSALPLTVDEIASSGLVSASVLADLDSEEVYGLWTYGKRHQEMWRERDEDGEPRDRYRMVPKAKDEWLAVPIPLSGAGLSRANVDAARERISSNTRRPPSTSAGRFWQLSGGIVHCAECGSALSPKSRRRRGKVEFWYLCRQRYGNGPRDCTHARMYRADVLENSVWRVVWELISDPEHIMLQYDQNMEHKRRQIRGNPRQGGARPPRKTREVKAEALGLPRPRRRSRH